MPPLSGGAHVLTYLWEIGPIESSGMGSGPITQTEMRSWQENTGVTLRPWEIRFLRSLSLEYISESHKAEKSDCLPPWQPEHLTQEHREAVSRQVQNALRALMIGR